jgi:hypothetical protein
MPKSPYIAELAPASIARGRKMADVKQPPTPKLHFSEDQLHQIEIELK